MRKLILPLVAFLVFCSHDMYFKPDSYFLPANTFATIQLYNGTYEASENTIDRERMLDVSLLGNSERTAVPEGQWSEVDKSTVLTFKTGEPGTWVAGVSTKARDFTQTAEAFNRYLAHDGVVDMLESRKQEGVLNEEARERYSKHVKTIFQVGDALTDDYATPLGYPIEFVPLANPYGLKVGDQLSAKLLRNGQPLAGELVYVDTDGGAHDHAHDHGDGEHSHDENEEHTHTKGEQYRTDQEGNITFEITNGGVWHLRTIHMEKKTEDDLTHESNWTTLTFAVAGQAGAMAHSHGDDDHSHSHDGDEHSHDHGGGAHVHADEGVAGMPPYIWWGASLLIVAGLFAYFNRKDA